MQLQNSKKMLYNSHPYPTHSTDGETHEPPIGINCRIAIFFTFTQYFVATGC